MDTVLSILPDRGARANLVDFLALYHASTAREVGGALGNHAAAFAKSLVGAVRRCRARTLDVSAATREYERFGPITRTAQHHAAWTGGPAWAGGGGGGTETGRWSVASSGSASAR